MYPEIVSKRHAPPKRVKLECGRLWPPSCRVIVASDNNPSGRESLGKSLDPHAIWVFIQQLVHCFDVNLSAKLVEYNSALTVESIPPNLVVGGRWQREGEHLVFFVFSSSPHPAHIFALSGGRRADDDDHLGRRAPSRVLEIAQPLEFLLPNREAGSGVVHADEISRFSFKNHVPDALKHLPLVHSVILCANNWSNRGTRWGSGGPCWSVIKLSPAHAFSRRAIKENACVIFAHVIQRSFVSSPARSDKDPSFSV